MNMSSGIENRIIIAGAGLGGLALALCLQQEGFDVLVLEQAQALGEVGAGVQISANGARVLYHVGLEDQIKAVAFQPERGEMRHWQTGETILTRPLGTVSVEKFGFPYFHLHRADFHNVMHKAMEQRAPGCIQTATKVVAFREEADHVVVRSEDGREFKAALLIGCDGIHSYVRQLLFGADQPRFTGCTAWRTTLPVESLPKDHVRPVASNWIGRGGHFVHYYLRRGELVNCIGVIERDRWTAESWSAKGDVADFLADFKDWHPDLKLLIERAESCYFWGLFDRDPMPEWGRGRVTLLGDACHAMLPFMAQGAVMGLEDALTLARCLAVNGPTSAALRRYEDLRRDRTAFAQKLSRGNQAFFHNADRPDLMDHLTGHREAHLQLYGFDVSDQDFKVS